MKGYEHLTERIYTDWINDYEGMNDRINDLAARKKLVLRIDLIMQILEEEKETPTFYGIDIGFSFLDMESCRTEMGRFTEKLGAIDNNGFADDRLASTLAIYILLEAIIEKLNDEISFEFEYFENLISDSNCQAVCSIYIKSKQLPELTKLKSVADYLDRHQLDLDMFEQCNCIEGNMTDVEKYICNELVTKPGNRNLEAILDEIRTQF